MYQAPNWAEAPADAEWGSTHRAVQNGYMRTWRKRGPNNTVLRWVDGEWEHHEDDFDQWLEANIRHVEARPAPVNMVVDGVDWAEAPEGTTHYLGCVGEEPWVRIENGHVSRWRGGHWVRKAEYRHWVGGPYGDNFNEVKVNPFAKQLVEAKNPEPIIEKPEKKVGWW